MTASRILVVEDDAQLREALIDMLEMAGFHCLQATDGQDALSRLESEDISLIVSDVQMRPMDGITLLAEVRKRFAHIPLLLMTAYATVNQAVEAMRNGAIDYLVKPFDAQVLVHKVSQCIDSGHDDSGEVVAVDARSRELLALARRVAESDATVMITGPSGAGKEVIARFIHDNSSRADRPFVAINCAAIPDNMLEAVLFGYEKGAFTGAYKSSPGKFEQAQGGTLLLDEISEMNQALQAKLLRVLQEREVERLGSQQMIDLDVRVLATSNRNMRAEVDAGKFREDLYYRLNVFPLELVALNQRTDDIVPLSRHLLARHAERNGQNTPQFSREAEQKLTSYPWPGNVRELDNVLHRALILHKGDTVEVGDLIFESAPQGGSQAAPAHSSTASEEIETLQPEGLGNELKDRERILIEEALKECNGSRKDAAERLGISPRTLRYKLQKLREAGVQL